MHNSHKKGQVGEQKTAYFSVAFDGYGKSLRNVYVPMKNGRTTEIDQIIVHVKGIFVIESKNYRGWIFGQDKDNNWTQRLPDGRKFQFYNPVKQNQLHISALKSLLSLEDGCFISFIVFGNDCDFKKVKVAVPNTYMMKWVALPSKLQAVIGSEERKLEGIEVNRIYECLKPFSQVSEQTKQKHIDDIKKQISR